MAYLKSLNTEKYSFQKPSKFLLGTAFSLALVGCASQSGDSVPVDSSAASDSSAAEIRAQESRISALEQQLRSRESTIDELEGKIASSGSRSASAMTTGGSASDELFPPNALPGQCFARVLYPETYKTSEERILSREASERFEVVPATYSTGEERVLVKEASSRLEIVPATYKTVEERILVKAASNRVVEVPATYEFVTETVLDKPAHTVWKKGSPNNVVGNVLSESVSATGELMCLVEVPATYKTVKRRVVASAASTRSVEIPAEYKTVKRTVVDQPASTREVSIPAVYDTVKVTKLVDDASSRKIEIPAEYKTITKREKVTDARMEWQQVLCSINATGENVRALQTALDKKGYDVGGIDGVLGGATIKAVNKYAQSIGVPQGANYVPVDVLNKLGLSI